MKNLNYPIINEINELDAIIESKHTDTRSRLKNIRPLILTNYNEYLNNFSNIHTIGPSSFDSFSTKDLNDCYKNKTKPVNKLLDKIITNQTTQFQFICPYCLLLPKTTYDHYIPEGTYPAYSILAKNIIPSCDTCNKKKLEYWRDSNARTIIHFYNDIIPDQQFLFATISFTSTQIPRISFTLHNTSGITSELFSIIQTHFDRLDLLSRYADNLNLVISDIIIDVEVNRSEFGSLVTAQTISNIIKKKASLFKQQYGVNYWKAVTMDVLSNSSQYINSL